VSCELGGPLQKGASERTVTKSRSGPQIEKNLADGSGFTPVGCHHGLSDPQQDVLIPSMPCTISCQVSIEGFELETITPGFHLLFAPEQALSLSEPFIFQEGGVLSALPDALGGKGSPLYSELDCPHCQREVPGMTNSVPPRGTGVSESLPLPHSKVQLWDNLATNQEVLLNHHRLWPALIPGLRFPASDPPLPVHSPVRSIQEGFLFWFKFW
jgi:hypothetical protein